MEFEEFAAAALVATFITYSVFVLIGDDSNEKDDE